MSYGTCRVGVRERTLDAPIRLCLGEFVPTSAERLVDINGVGLRVIEAGERGAPVVVLAHGFPELAFSWRHQIPVLTEAGYHVLAGPARLWRFEPARCRQGL